MWDLEIETFVVLFPIETNVAAETVAQYMTTNRRWPVVARDTYCMVGVLGRTILSEFRKRDFR